ncbi:hypothetical protein TNCV_3906311 [Trichonephila clavipes]|nr:hypothetical protein TNCV_3906311 [Trichonephila clavipes]
MPFKKILHLYNQELKVAEQKVKQEQDIEELESLDPVESEDRITIGNLAESLSLTKKGLQILENAYSGEKARAMKVARFNETFPQAELRRFEQAERDAAHRAAVTPERSQARRRRQAEYLASQRAAKTPEQSQARRLQHATYMAWRAVGWMEMGLSQADAPRRLNVSLDFGINTNPKILCPEDLFQADHELQHLQKTVF